MNFRLLVVMSLLTLFALWREVVKHVDYSRYVWLSHTQQTATVNGVPVQPLLLAERPSGNDLLAYRLSPPPGWSNSSFPALSPEAGTALIRSAALTSRDAQASGLSAR